MSESKEKVNDPNVVECNYCKCKNNSDENNILFGTTTTTINNKYLFIECTKCKKILIVDRSCITEKLVEKIIQKYNKDILNSKNVYFVDFKTNKIDKLKKYLSKELKKSKETKSKETESKELSKITFNRGNKKIRVDNFGYIYLPIDNKCNYVCLEKTDNLIAEEIMIDATLDDNVVNSSFSIPSNDCIIS